MVAIILPIILLSPSLTLAQSSAGPCVSDCGHILSSCDGDETGPGRDDCRYDTYYGNGLCISRIKACPAAEFATYAGALLEKL